MIELPPLRRYSVTQGWADLDSTGLLCAEADHEARERILMARIAELEADASRYRWLRDKSPGQWTLQVGDLPLFKGDVDAAIDAAMKEPKQ